MDVCLKIPFEVPYVIHLKSTIKQSLSQISFANYLLTQLLSWVMTDEFSALANKYVSKFYTHIVHIMYVSYTTCKIYNAKYGLSSFVAIFSILEFPLHASSYIARALLGPVNGPFPIEFTNVFSQLNLC